MDSPWTQDYKFSSTGYERNDHFIQEGYVEYTQESLGEQRFPDDFDYDDVTISKTLLDACRRQADHSEEEGLSSCVSSSVSLIERWDPLWNRLTHKFKVFEKFRATAQKVGKSGLSWSDTESRFSLTVKQRFENTKFKPFWLKKFTKIKWNDRVAARRTLSSSSRTNFIDKINNFFMNNYWSKIWNYVKLTRKVSLKWKNWSDFRFLPSTQLREED